MDLRRLSFLVRAIDMGSITRAAEALRIAQPALSQHIQALERSFGTALLTRSAHGVTPTEAGKVVYRNARQMARQIDQARAEVKILASAPAGRVTVGVAPHSHARTLIQPLLRATRERFPSIVLHINENFEGILATDLLMKRVDMAFLYEIIPRPGFTYTTVLEERLQLVGSRKLFRAERSDDAAAGSAPAGIPLLLPGPSHALRQLVDAVFSSRRQQPRVVAEIESFETLVAAVRAGLGATILPASVAAELAMGAEMHLRPFGGARARVALSLCIAKEVMQSEAARAIYALAGELSGQLGSGRGVPAAGPPIRAKALPAGSGRGSLAMSGKGGHPATPPRKDAPGRGRG